MSSNDFEYERNIARNFYDQVIELLRELDAQGRWREGNKLHFGLRIVNEKAMRQIENEEEERTEDG